MTIKPNLAIECDTLALLERMNYNAVDLVYLNPPSVYRDREKEDYHEFLFRVIQQCYRCLKCLPLSSM